MERHRARSVPPILFIMPQVRCSPVPRDDGKLWLPMYFGLRNRDREYYYVYHCGNLRCTEFVNNTSDTTAAGTGDKRTAAPACAQHDCALPSMKTPTPMFPAYRLCPEKVCPGVVDYRHAKETAPPMSKLTMIWSDNLSLKTEPPIGQSGVRFLL